MRREERLEHIIEFAKNNPDDFFAMYAYWITGAILFVVSVSILYLSNKENFPEEKDEENKEITKNKSQTLQSWQCPNCHEILEGQFDTCWNCLYEKEEVIVNADNKTLEKNSLP
jgi:hypothetical protein